MKLVRRWRENCGGRPAWRYGLWVQWKVIADVLLRRWANSLAGSACRALAG